MQHLKKACAANSPSFLEQLFVYSAAEVWPHMWRRRDRTRKSWTTRPHICCQNRYKPPRGSSTKLTDLCHQIGCSNMLAEEKCWLVPLAATVNSCIPDLWRIQTSHSPRRVHSKFHAQAKIVMKLEDMGSLQEKSFEDVVCLSRHTVALKDLSANDQAKAAQLRYALEQLVHISAWCRMGGGIGQRACNLLRAHAYKPTRNGRREGGREVGGGRTRGRERERERETDR